MTFGLYMPQLWWCGGKMTTRVGRHIVIPLFSVKHEEKLVSWKQFYLLNNFLHYYLKSTTVTLSFSEIVSWAQGHVVSCMAHW